MTAERFSVDEVLLRLDELDGQRIAIEGHLQGLYEDVAIYQLSMCERIKDHSEWLNSNRSIWMHLGDAYKQELGRPLRQHLASFDGRRGIVVGVLRAPGRQAGCGHFGCWPAEIVVESIDPY